MKKEEIEELAMLVNLYEYCKDKIEEAKQYFRSITDEEQEFINKTTNLHIDRSPQVFTEYSNEYKKAKKELEMKFPPTKTKVENYKISLKTNRYINSKTELLQNIIVQNKTTLKEMQKLVK